MLKTIKSNRKEEALSDKETKNDDYELLGFLENPGSPRYLHFREALALLVNVQESTRSVSMQSQVVDHIGLETDSR